MKKSTNLQIYKYTNGFSLIELLVAIAIIATIIAIAIPNFLGARQRARDARKKSEIQQLKTALSLYYQDYGVFPSDSGASPYNTIKGCLIYGTATCPGTCTADFAAGGETGCQTTYMNKFPVDFGTEADKTMSYYRRNSGADFCLKVPLENLSDADALTTQRRCATICPGLFSGSDYIVCSE